MRRRAIVAVALALALVGGAAGPAAGGPVPDLCLRPVWCN